MSPDLTAVLDDLTSAPAGPWQTVGFRQGGGSVTFRTDRPEVMQTAIDTLYSYRITPPAPAGWEITIRAAAVFDTAAIAEIFTTAPLREIGPRLDARVVHSSRGQTYWVAAHAMLIHTNPHTAAITAHHTNPESARSWAARLVRQTMTAQLLAGGAVYAHAAAFSHRGRGVLIIGPKSAGKTTTLVASLRLLGGDYVTNDRLLLGRESGELLGRAWPAHMRVGVGTLLAIPDLVDLVPARLRELPEHQRWHHRDKVTIEPPKFSRLLSSGVVISEVRPCLMLWPSLSRPGGHGAAPVAVSADEVHDVLLDTQLFMVNPTSGVNAHVNHWLIDTGPAARTAENLRQVVDDLATHVPCYRIPVGGDPAALAARINDLLARIAPVNDTRSPA